MFARPISIARTAVALAAFALVACAESPRSDEPGTADGPEAPAAEPVAAPEDSAGGEVAEATPVERWLRRLPPDALTRRDACPFECCVYREWTAESRIPLVGAPGSDPGSAALYLEPGTVFEADSGFVRVVEAALVAVTEEVQPMPERTLAPGDTLLLLDYVGEGFYNVWLDGEVVEVADFWSSATDRPRGKVIGERVTEWWVHATAPDGSSGWFRADAPGVELGGVDACG